MNALKRVQLSLLKHQKLFKSSSLYRPSTNTSTEETSQESDDNPVNDNGGFSENEIEQMRDISRLTTRLRNRMEHVMIMDQARIEKRRHIRFLEDQIKRSEYAKFGRASGIDAGIMWPPKEELKVLIDDEKEWEPTLQEMWEANRLEKEEKEEMIRSKQKHVEEQMKKMPEYIEGYKNRLRKQLKQEEEQVQKRQAQLDDAREYLGFSLDPRDPRFKQMMEMRAEEEAKEKKKRKKLEKQMRLMQVAQKQALGGAGEGGEKKAE